MHDADRDFQISETVQSLRRIFKAIQDYSQEVSGSFGITGPQLWALKTLSEYESLPLGELSRKMYLHPSTVTGVVDRLETKGLRDEGQRSGRQESRQGMPDVCGQASGQKRAQPCSGQDDIRLKESERRRAARYL